MKQNLDMTAKLILDSLKTPRENNNQKYKNKISNIENFEEKKKIIIQI